ERGTKARPSSAGYTPGPVRRAGRSASRPGSIRNPDAGSGSRLPRKAWGCRPSPRPPPIAAPRSETLEDGCDALPAADAHGHQRIAPAGAPQFVHGLDGEDGAGGADRMAQRNAAAVGVEFFRIEAEFACHGAGLRGKGLVGL